MEKKGLLLLIELESLRNKLNLKAQETKKNFFNTLKQKNKSNNALLLRLRCYKSTNPQSREKRNKWELNNPDP